MPEDYVGWPQRRDFPVGGEPVIFTNNEPRPGVVRVSDASAETIRHETLERAEASGSSARRRSSAPPPRTLEPEQELLTINMGPHHPATHGVLRLLVNLEGEVVRDLKPVMGYVHTGIEKNCEDKAYWKVIPFVERMDYLSYFFQMEAFCGCRRADAGARDPAAGQVPASHPHGAEPDPLAPRLARDLGARPRRDVDVLLLLPRARQDPRPVRDVDRPAHAHPLLPGRRRLRGHPARLRAQACAPSATRCRRGSTSTRRSSTRTRSSCSRTRNVGVVPRQRLLELGRDRAAAARRRRALGPAQGRPLPRLRGVRLPRSRSGRSATATTATACGCRRCASR